MPPKVQPRLSKRHSRRGWTSVSGTWVLEAAALILAIAALVTIIILLSIYNGHSQFHWHGVTLNTIVAILAAVVRVGFVLPVGESLAQWKWLEFSRKPRPLSDFDTIDDASRGSRGSLLLLWKTKGLYRSSTSLQANNNTNAAARIPYAQKWNGGSENSLSGPEPQSSNPNGNNLTILITDYGSVSQIALDASGQLAVQSGLITSAQGIAQRFPTTCPSGNCTWPSYLSLAICSACADVSDEISHRSKQDAPMGWFFPSWAGFKTGYASAPAENLTSYYLPNGLNIDNKIPAYKTQGYGYSTNPVMMTSQGNFSPSKSLTFKKYTTLLYSSTFMHVANSSFPFQGTWQSGEPEIHATECGIYLCIKKYTSVVENGVLNESSSVVTSTRGNASFEPIFTDEQDSVEYGEGISPNVDALYSPNTYFPRSDLQIVVPPGTNSANDLKFVNITQSAIDALSLYVSSIFESSTFTNLTIQIADSNCTSDGATVPCGRLRHITGMVVGNDSLSSSSILPTEFEPPILSGLWQASSLRQRFENLAMSISNEMRQDAELQPTVAGSLGQSLTILKVRWEWITLPIFLIVVSIIFFLGSIWETKHLGIPIWKSSVLPVLCHGLEDPVRKGMERSNATSEMDEAAKAVKVRLGSGADDVLLLRKDN
ncbi:hypothetical protein H2200_007349 [Cladophialophora chaetospira]|uniref:Uncharacterized protein n=1 Tax=Cladophialophora chaetospira TaxID=386627 RepID=A0AA38X7R6_9EURO|nr:hypothetical protein H2200_007349 [Cladophialophora chaetospira]